MPSRTKSKTQQLTGEKTNSIPAETRTLLLNHW